MFTKYNNVNIPENYSGNRFRQATEDTKMKTHRATPATTSASGTKTSVSPYFQAKLNNDDVFVSQDDTDSINEEITEAEQEENAEIIDTPTDKTVEVSTATAFTSNEENKLMQLFKNIKNDDLLLLALILLFSKDSAESGADALVILALLLMYH